MVANHEAEVNVKFANGNGMAFLGQGYITSGDKKVFVRLYTTSDLRRVIVKMFHHHGYGFQWDQAKDLGLIKQEDCNNGTMITFNRITLFYKTECYHEYIFMSQLEIAFRLMNFKLL